MVQINTSPSLTKLSLLIADRLTPDYKVLQKIYALPRMTAWRLLHRIGLPSIRTIERLAPHLGEKYAKEALTLLSAATLEVGVTNRRLLLTPQ